MVKSRLLLALLLLAVVAGSGGWYAWSGRKKNGPEDMLAEGQNLLRAGDASSADRLVNQLSVRGHREHAALLRGEILFRKKEFKRAEAEFAQVDGKSALYPQAAVLYAHCRLETGDLPLAEGLFKGVLEDHPNDIEAHRGLAQVYFVLGANTRVIEQLDIVANLDPQDTRPWMYKGGFYADVGLLTESVQAYEEALARSKTPEQISLSRLGLAESLLKFGQHLRAQEVLAALPESHLSDPRALTLRADALCRNGQFDNARTLLAPVVAAASPSSADLTVAGRIEFQAGAYDRAINYLEVASKDPSQYEGRYLLAQALNRSGREKEGAVVQAQADAIRADLQQMSHLVDVAGANPWDRSVRDKLAEISAKLGKNDVAEKWRQAAKICPPPPPKK